MKSFKDFINEDKEKTKIFPSDEIISEIANEADKAFWDVVVKNIKDKYDLIDFKPSKELEEFKKQQINIIKNWLKTNWFPEMKNPVEAKVKKINIQTASNPMPQLDNINVASI